MNLEENIRKKSLLIEKKYKDTKNDFKKFYEKETTILKSKIKKR